MEPHVVVASAVVKSVSTVITAVVVVQMVAAAEDEADYYGHNEHSEKVPVHDFGRQDVVPVHQTSAPYNYFYFTFSNTCSFSPDFHFTIHLINISFSRGVNSS